MWKKGLKDRGGKKALKDPDNRSENLICYVDRERYLAEDGSQSPLTLGRLLQLRPAPKGAQYTICYDNRTHGCRVRMVSNQYMRESELLDDAADLRADFGGLVFG